MIKYYKLPKRNRDGDYFYLRVVDGRRCDLYFLDEWQFCVHTSEDFDENDYANWPIHIDNVDRSKIEPVSPAEMAMEIFK